MVIFTRRLQYWFEDLQIVIKMPETRAIKAALEKTTGSRLAEGAVRNQVLKLRYKTSLG